MHAHNLRLRKFLILFLVWFCVASLVSTKDTFSMKMSSYFITKGYDLRVTFHVPYRPENRRLEYRWESEDYLSQSDIDLTDGGNAVTTQVTFDRWLKNLPRGHYEIQAILRGLRDGKADDISATPQEFEVQ